MMVVVLSVLAVISGSPQAALQARGPLCAYPSYDGICDSLEILSMLYPSICEYVSIGTTYGGRDIMALVISDNVQSEEVEPEILLAGCVHGNEKASAMTALQYAEWLAEHYSSDPNAQYIINTAEVWFVPVANPDGYAANTMNNGRGVNVDRNFETFWSSGGSGSAPFSEEESKALRDLTFPNWPSAANAHNPFTAGLSLHSGDSYFMYVWSGMSGSVWDSDLILDTADEYNLLNLDPGMTVVNGWNLYPVYGETSDWYYDVVGTIHSHVGVCPTEQPADWQTVANNHTNALNNFCRDATYGIWGTVANSSGTPLNCVVNVARRDGATTEILNYSRCDMEAWGDYAKMLLPGNYDVTASVSGYTPQTVQNIAVAANQRVEVSFVLYPLGVEGGEAGAGVSLAISPNPSSGAVRFDVQAGPGGGSIEVFDLSGRRVFSSPAEPGESSQSWSASGEDGSLLPSGVYLARLVSDGAALSRMIVLRR